MTISAVSHKIKHHYLALTNKLGLCFCLCLALLLATTINSSKADELESAEDTQQRPVVHIFSASSMASSLTELSEEIAEKFGIDIKLSLAASSQLAKQIEQGAPADIFISAHPEWIEYLKKQQLLSVEHTTSEWLRNEMILVQNFNPITLTLTDALQQITEEEIRGTIADPDYVPSGKYAKKLLQQNQQWQELSPLIVPAGSAQNVLQYLQQNTFSWGVIYQTDWQTLVSSEDKLGSLNWQKIPLINEINEKSQGVESVKIGLAVVEPFDDAESSTMKTQRQAVQKVYDYLQTSEGVEYFLQYGFRAG